MVDFGGIFAKEISQDLKDAITDPSSVRTNVPTAANPLATLSDVGGGGGGGGGGAALKKLQVVKVDGDFSTSDETGVEVTGTLINVTFAEQREVLVAVSGTIRGPNESGDNAAGALGIKVDGALHFGPELGSTAPGRFPAAFVKAFTLNAGAHTIEMALRKKAGSPDPVLEVSASTPAVIVAAYTDPVFGIAALTKQSSGPNSHSNSSTAFSAVPGSSVSVALQTSQVVLITADGTALLGSGRVNSVIGIRITSPGPVVQDFPGPSSVNGDDKWKEGLSITRAVLLAAGTHTVSAIIARSSSLGTSASMENIHLTVIYTEPKALDPAQVLFTAVDPATYELSGVAAMTFSLDGTGSSGKIFNVPGVSNRDCVVMANCQAMRLSATGIIQYLVEIDGLSVGAIDITTPDGERKADAAIIRKVTLTPGAHTVKLKLTHTDGGTPANDEAVGPHHVSIIG